MSSKTIMRQPIIGTSHLNISSSLIFAILAPTNRLTPTGGVHIPITRLTTRIVPKCTGLTPSYVTMGSRMGDKIMIAARVSISIPTKNKNTLIRSSTTIRLLETDRIAAAIELGT